MTSQKIGFIMVIAGFIVWGGSIGIAKILVPERNPPVLYQGPIIGKQSDLILQRSCFDCHSNETQWPWYSYMPIISVLLAHDVAEGRDEMNFSEWSRYSVKKQKHKLKESIEEISEGEMPMKIYTWTHPYAVIAPEELSLLKKELLKLEISMPKEMSSDKSRDDHDDD
ncbi:MAG: heme-binding domain-containing protein [SAR324 cluster bacterium]|nr:heme-binding domain-containing protein [SAR324 cluster bacterium]